MGYHIHLHDALLHWCTALQTRLSNKGIRAKRMQPAAGAKIRTYHMHTHTFYHAHTSSIQFPGIPVPV